MPSPQSSPHQLSTGVPGFDEVLGGGLAEGSFTLIAGGPGAGKTTLVHQFLFHQATAARPALFFTVLGEPTVKLLRHQGQFTYFDTDRVGADVHLVCLTDQVGYGYDAYLAAIEEHIQRLNPAFVAVDSFRAVLRAIEAPHPVDLARFVQGLALLLTSLKVTSFLVGEYEQTESSHPVFTVADVIVSLHQAVDRNSIVRKLQVVKSRGQAGMPGLHTFRITNDGVQVFPRIPIAIRDTATRLTTRLSTGIPLLDELMAGGVPLGDVLLVSGPSGSGKTTLAMQFALDGLQRGESVVVAGFEEPPGAYIARARSLGGPAFDEALAAGRFHVLYLRPLDLSVDETMFELQQAVVRTKATRVVIDSLSGFEVALAPTFRLDFRESLYRLLGALTSLEVTVALTNEVNDSDPEHHLTRYGVSFLCDDIVLFRYVEIDGEYRRVLTVLKMRRSRHSPAIHGFETTSSGIQVGPTLQPFQGLLGPAPQRISRTTIDFHGLSTEEARVGHAIRRAGKITLDELLEVAGLDARSLDDALERLVKLEYAVFSQSDEGGTFATLSRQLP